MFTFEACLNTFQLLKSAIHLSICSGWVEISKDVIYVRQMLWIYVEVTPKYVSMLSWQSMELSFLATIPAKKIIQNSFNFAIYSPFYTFH